jgi:hypothetical protein
MDSEQNQNQGFTNVDNENDIENTLLFNFLNFILELIMKEQ